MRVVHLSTFERAGGAAIAAARLHLGLRSAGCESTMVVRDRTDGDGVDGVEAAESLDGGLASPALTLMLYRLYTGARRPGIDLRFSADVPATDVGAHPAVEAADVVNLHWVSDFVSSPAVRAIQDRGKPVVWTLHDQAPFTGGCHYSGGCERHTGTCGPCPALDDHAAHVPALVLGRKQEWIRAEHLHVVCPSEWLAARARSSALLRRASISTIPNSVPVEIFRRPHRREARAALGLSPDAVVLLVAAERLDESRKGGNHAAQILDRLAASPSVQPLVTSGRLVCLALGEGVLAERRLPIVHTGRLIGDAQLALAYRSADLFLLPTLEDNLPNTLLEAMAAGVPVVAYGSGGVPEMIRRSGCGTTAPTGDIAALAAETTALLTDTDARRRLGGCGMAYAARELNPAAHAAAYLRVYESACERQRSRKPTFDLAAFHRRVTASDDSLLNAVLGSPQTSIGILSALCEQNASQQALIAARGGEIVALRADLEDTTRQLRAAEERANGMRAAHAALARRWRHTMVRVVIYGAGVHGQRVWEAVAARGTADVVGFVDDDPRRHGRTLLGVAIESPEWLTRSAWDLLAIADPDATGLETAARRAGSHRVVTFPVDQDDDALARMAARVFPDPLGAMLAGRTAATGRRIGIFGTGAAAMKVWEALTGIDDADAAWFADNNPGRQGQRFLWLPVIAPADIPGQRFDAVVIGSMSRDPICAQLRALGVEAERTLAPDVSRDVERIREELQAMLERRQASA